MEELPEIEREEEREHLLYLLVLVFPPPPLTLTNPEELSELWEQIAEQTRQEPAEEPTHYLAEVDPAQPDLLQPGVGHRAHQSLFATTFVSELPLLTYLPLPALSLA